MKKYRNEKFEFTTRDISFFDIAEEQWPLDQRGALVEDVKPGSWAELGSLYADDLILEVGGEPVADVVDWLVFAKGSVPRLMKRYYGKEQDVQMNLNGTSFPILPLRD